MIQKDTDKKSSSNHRDMESFQLHVTFAFSGTRNKFFRNLI